MKANDNKSTITTEQIYEALKASEAHHLDGVNCTEDNYKEFDRSDGACALCKLYKCDCPPCVLHNMGTQCCEEWCAGAAARIKNDFTAYVKAELALYKRLRKLREEYEGKLKGEKLQRSLKATQQVNENYQKVMAKSKQPEKHQPKFAVGDSTLWGNERATVKSLVDAATTQQQYSILTENDNIYVVYENALSPLPDMSVGKEWVLEQDGNPWDGMRVKCVRESQEMNVYEQHIYQSEIHHKPSETYLYTGNKFACTVFIIICIDPAFWTGEICDERVRVYEDQDGDIRVFPIKSYSFVIQKSDRLLQYKVWLAAIKDAGIRIMPYKQSQGKYDSPTEK